MPPASYPPPPASTSPTVSNISSIHGHYTHIHTSDAALPATSDAHIHLREAFLRVKSKGANALRKACAIAFSSSSLFMHAFHSLRSGTPNTLQNRILPNCRGCFDVGGTLQQVRMGTGRRV